MMNYFVSVLRYNMVNDPTIICNNYTTVLSCVPGPIKPWTFLGSKVQEIFYIVPGCGDLGAGIGVITQGGKVQSTVACDLTYFPGEMHKEYLAKFEEIFKSAIDYL